MFLKKTNKRTQFKMTFSFTEYNFDVKARLMSYLSLSLAIFELI